MLLSEELFKFQDLKYRKFVSKLTKTKYQIIGVRIPVLKQFSKKIKNENILFSENKYFEEVMIEGLLIGYLKDIDEVVFELNSFVDQIDDWSICDSVCANLKITNKYKEKIWDFITKYKNSNKEFEIRFMVVMMMNYYLDENYIDDVFAILNNIKCDCYYAKMAISWLLATGLVKYEEETLNYLKRCSLDSFVFNKTISKACDSYRISSELKMVLRQMKR